MTTATCPRCSATIVGEVTGPLASDLLERVAIALFLAKNGANSKWDTFPLRYKQGYMGLAEAAINAMRDNEQSTTEKS